ncbi:MAG: hypothetical protein EBU90_28180, partial [Proteobacteria bacterium]|nr:hypothetical protein [Pseudomonadota bacterium]
MNRQDIELLNEAYYKNQDLQNEGLGNWAARMGTAAKAALGSSTAKGQKESQNIAVDLKNALKKFAGQMGKKVNDLTVQELGTILNKQFGMNLSQIVPNITNRTISGVLSYPNLTL